MKNLYLLAALLFIFSCKDKAAEKEETIKTPIENTIVEKEEPITQQKPTLIFTVQLGAFKNENKMLSSIAGIKIYSENGLTKYRLGEFETYKRAKEYKKQLKNNYPDAFVQALKNDYPIHITEALNN